MIANKNKAERLANEFLKKYYLKDPSRINLIDILGAERLFYQERSIKSSLGSLIRHKEYGQILINKSVTDKNQKRFIISHELGHWICHDDIPIFNCDHSKFKYWNKQISLIEKEANWFASEFLMPRQMFFHLCKGKKLSSDLIKSLSTYFKTSLTSTCIKFSDCGNESIAVVFSQSNNIIWSSFSKDFEYSFYGKDNIIPSTSITADYFKTQHISADAEVILAKDWFPRDEAIKDDKYLYEIVFPMPSYNACITLLWQHELNFENI